MLWGKFSIRLPQLPDSAATQLAVVGIFLDEGPYLAEWIEFHREVGVDHFFLYDNGSSDNGRDVIAHYMRDRVVTLIPWRWFAIGLESQRAAYAHAAANFGTDFGWFAFIDCDEFLFPRREATLPDVLGQYPHADAIYVPRLEFGTNGHKTRPSGLVIEIIRSALRVRSTTASRSPDRVVYWRPIRIEPR